MKTYNPNQPAATGFKRRKLPISARAAKTILALTVALMVGRAAKAEDFEAVQAGDDRAYVPQEHYTRVSQVVYTPVYVYDDGGGVEVHPIHHRHVYVETVCEDGRWVRYVHHYTR